MRLPLAICAAVVALAAGLVVEAWTDSGLAAVLVVGLLATIAVLRSLYVGDLSEFRPLRRRRD